MAKAYLQATVLTLVVALVVGQEASLESEKEIQVETKEIIEVLKESVGEDQNSYSDLLLFGSATSRADCIQKRKCKNKGGTCQNKGNDCAGKTAKGCAKGCSCCLLEEISCRRSKRCTKANGACISREECNGKIIAKGCRKPKRCKKTHVCCVKDESTTEAPTCPIGSRCPEEDNCPDQTFTTNYVCAGCKTNEQAIAKMNTLQLGPAIKSYALFADKTFSGPDTEPEEIMYDPSKGEQCKIVKKVKTWLCTLKSKGWSCTEQGYCVADIKKNGGIFAPSEINCPCANPSFEDKHKCSDCTDQESTVLTFANRYRPRNKMSSTVFVSKEKFVYTEVQPEKLCEVVVPLPVKGWLCESNAAGSRFTSCKQIGSCRNILSQLTTGHFEFPVVRCTETSTNSVASP